MFITHLKFFLSLPVPLQDSASDKSHRKESGSSDRVTSPPPISLGKKVEVDLKEKQKKFEGLDKHAEEVMINFDFQASFALCEGNCDFELAKVNNESSFLSQSVQTNKILILSL